MTVSGNQIRAARALAGWEQRDLAEAAEVSINTVRNMEACGASIVRVRSDTLDHVIRALRQGGVEFIPENGGGAGVRLRKQSS
ncbi:helix-turn-helix transcriptional regulator [Roseomonas mucosa]|nr:helix-turn-helix transcriptional regulator [Roseomonas mucosa]MDT8296226.1 helix-turn-helix transcriptional regulator [Roseomonas mucosa]